MRMVSNAFRLKPLGRSQTFPWTASSGSLMDMENV